MFDVNDKIIYVGKAKNLKNRVTNYFQKTGHDLKKHALMQQAVKIEVTITANENEALLLEGNLIKQYKPRYNILFKDDKSFPYLVLSKDKFPRLFSYRGAKEVGYEYFGPYSNSLATRETLHFAQKVFCIRSCSDTFFRHRTRPCLQYQIQRCTAPCVGYVSEAEYHEQVSMLEQLLRGKNRIVLDELTKRMQEAAADKKFELAAQYRDKIAYIREVQTPQRVTKEGGESDVIALVEQGGVYCLQVLFVRFGSVVGSQAYFPNVPEFSTLEEVITAFLTQKYLDFAIEKGVPKNICINIYLAERAVLQETLNNVLNTKTKLLMVTTKGKYHSWMQMALTNAKESVQRHLLLHANLLDRFQVLQTTLQLTDLPQRIECFDVSHSAGEATVAACVVFTTSGAEKKDYRHFNIENVAAGDDYAAMYQALLRRYGYLKEHPAKMPQILLIDGGAGQLNIAANALEALALENIILLAITKDSERKSGVDFIYQFRFTTKNIVSVDCPAPALHLLQQIRDETHRFAVTSHRQKRAKKRRGSILEDIAGIGQKKRLALYKHFGGLQEVKQADVAALVKVPGVNQKLAEEIYRVLHEENKI